MLVHVSQALKLIGKDRVDQAVDAMERLLDRIASLESNGFLTAEQADDLSSCTGDVIAAF